MTSPLDDGIVPNLSPEISINNNLWFLNTLSNDRSDGWIERSGLRNLGHDTLTVSKSVC